MKKIFILLSLIFIAGLTHTFAQSYKVIVNENNSTASLTAKEASDFFLKKKTKWPSGTAVMPVDLSSNSSVREAFSQKIHGKGTAAIRNFWQQAAFSGAGTAPSEKASDADVIEFVKKNPGGIGYVSSGASVAGVKVIDIK
jgi:ABC-type phosphate transport system substrate-binding protein